MSDSFNGYHVWLGIPPSEQPPNHYRLLGIAIFETDLDVIDHAADRQMAHVRTFQAGRHAGLSQRILNELAAARVCLLNPQRKVNYDSELKAKLAASPQVAAVPMGRAVPMAQPAIPTAIPAGKPQPTPTATPISAPAKSAPTKTVPAKTVPTKTVPTKTVPAAIPIDDDDDYGLETADLSQAQFDDYEEELATATGSGTPMINPLAVRGSNKSDLAFQRAIVYTLVGVAVVIVLMIGYNIFTRVVGPVNELFKSAPTTETAVEAAPLAPAAPSAPAPVPPGGLEDAGN